MTLCWPGPSCWTSGLDMLNQVHMPGQHCFKLKRQSSGWRKEESLGVQRVPISFFLVSWAITFPPHGSSGRRMWNGSISISWCPTDFWGPSAKRLFNLGFPDLPSFFIGSTSKWRWAEGKKVSLLPPSLSLCSGQRETLSHQFPSSLAKMACQFYCLVFHSGEKSGDHGGISTEGHVLCGVGCINCWLLSEVFVFLCLLCISCIMPY